MAALLHVHRDPRADALIQPFRSSGINVIDAAPDDSVSHVAAAAAADMAVIAADVDAPVRVARAIHRGAPQAHIVFITDAASEPALRRELLLAPRIGRHWSMARSDTPEAAKQTIRTAIEATAQRRQTRTTMHHLNRRLTEHAPATRAVVNDHFLAATLQQLSDGVVMIDPAGRVLMANEAARRIFGSGLTRGGMLAAALENGSAQLAERMAAADEDATSEITVRRDGRPLLLELRVTKVRDERGEILGMAILARDVTEHRLAERRQRLLGDLSMALSSTASIDVAMQRLAEFLARQFRAVAAVDLVDGETIVRRGAAVMPPNDHLGATLRALTPVSEAHPGIAAFRHRKALVANAVDDDFLRRSAVNEEHFQLLRSLDVRAVVAQPLAADRRAMGAFVVGRAEPFSPEEVKLLEEIAATAAASVQTIWLYHAAEEANRAKEEFLATLSHELRTPMTAVLGWVQLVRSDPGDPQMLRDALEAMEQSARAQAQLIDDLLDLSRIRLGKLHLQMQTVDLGQLVRAAAETIRPAAGAKYISLQVEVEDEVVVAGDPNRLQQVIWNLLSNSVKFTDRGGSVVIRARREASVARLEVRDTGRGIEAEFLPYVFERFRQSDSAATRRYGGLGLGLAIVKQIVELHGGTVTAASDGPGRGATFTIELPLGLERSAAAATDGDSESLLSGLSILLVEDHAAPSHMLCSALKRSGAEVRCERSVAAALEALRGGIPDVLITEIAMPGEDGFALIRTVRSTLRIPEERVPAIALSALSDVQTRVEVLGAGFQRFLQKPVDTGLLTRTVAELAHHR